MPEYANKEALIEEINRTADLFIQEFDGVAQEELDLRFDEVDRTPREMLAYQLGWMELLRGWDREELAGRKVSTPAEGLKWNQMGELYQQFYAAHSTETLEELRRCFTAAVADFACWVEDFSDDSLFLPGGRGWASSTPSNWPVWKWIHTNTVAPFKTFRSKIRKWKKLREEQRPR